MMEDDNENVREYRKKLVGYAKPSVTADIVVVRPCWSEPDASKWRENPRFALEMLLIKRGIWPHKGTWALPGGFIQGEGFEAKESVEQGAARELKEETGLKADPYELMPVGVFSKPGRDMRAWIISNAFISIRRIGEMATVKGSSDAAAADWLRIDSLSFAAGKFRIPFMKEGKTLFEIAGTYKSDDFGGGRVTGAKVRNGPLAFDHGEIIATAFLRMLSFDHERLALLFLGNVFTLADYVSVYQYLIGKELDRSSLPNLRRQLTAKNSPLLEPCPGSYEKEGKGHRVAQLYRRRKMMGAIKK